MAVRIARRRLIATAAALATVRGSARPAAAQPAAARFFRIATGPTETGMFQMGALIGSAVSSPPGARECERGGTCGVPGLIVVTQATAGALANIELIAQGKIESALCQADIAYAAFHGTGIYRRQGAVRNLRAIANLYPETLHIVVRADSGVGEIGRLRGKRVSFGPRDSATAVAARATVQAAGLAERDLRVQALAPGEAAEALKDGRIDAFFEMAAAPSETLDDLAKETDIALLPVSGAVAQRLRAAHPFLTAATIPAGAYRGVDEKATVAVGVLWIVAAQVEERIVHGLTRALFHPNNRRTIDSGHPLGRLIRPEYALDGVAFETHPGAALYYFEAGLLR